MPWNLRAHHVNSTSSNTAKVRVGETKRIGHLYQEDGKQQKQKQKTSIPFSV